MACEKSRTRDGDGSDTKAATDGEKYDDAGLLVEASASRRLDRELPPPRRSSSCGRHAAVRWNGCLHLFYGTYLECVCIARYVGTWAPLGSLHYYVSWRLSPIDARRCRRALGEMFALRQTFLWVFRPSKLLCAAGASADLGGAKESSDEPRSKIAPNDRVSKELTFRSTLFQKHGAITSFVTVDMNDVRKCAEFYQGS